MNANRPYKRKTVRDKSPPPPSSKGPVFSFDERSLLADVDPMADPIDINRILAAKSHRLRHAPSQPFLPWLKTLTRAEIARIDSHFFAVQGRFEDGSSVHLDPCPRSAGGPDLRWELLSKAEIEMIQVPTIPIFDS